MSEAETPAVAPQTKVDGDSRQVLLQKIYVKDASLEVPLAPQVFTRPWQPQLDVNVTTQPTPMADDRFHLVLSVTVTAKLGEDTAFLIEVQQAGVFVVRGFNSDAERGAALGAYCPNLLFPFARQVIADLAMSAGFPQLLLQPINFDALYMEHLNRARAQAEAAATTGRPN